MCAGRLYKYFTGEIGKNTHMQGNSRIYIYIFTYIDGEKQLPRAYQVDIQLN